MAQIMTSGYGFVKGQVLSRWQKVRSDLRYLHLPFKLFKVNACLSRMNWTAVAHSTVSSTQRSSEIFVSVVAVGPSVNSVTQSQQTLTISLSSYKLKTHLRFCFRQFSAA